MRKYDLNDKVRVKGMPLESFRVSAVALDKEGTLYADENSRWFSEDQLEHDLSIIQQEILLRYERATHDLTLSSEGYNRLRSLAEANLPPRLVELVSKQVK